MLAVQRGILFSLVFVFGLGMACAQTRPKTEKDEPKFEVSVTEAATGKKAERLLKEAERRSEISKRFTQEYRMCRGLLDDRKLKEAETTCNAALRLADQLESDRKYERTLAYEYVGHVMLGQKRYQEALKYYSRSLEFVQPEITEEDATLGRLYGNIGMAEHMLGNLDKARELYRKSERIYHRAYTTFTVGNTVESDVSIKENYLDNLKMILRFHLRAAKDAGATSEVDEVEKLMKSLP
jgi:tetratricopeptide (TPR) repeat protein